MARRIHHHSRLGVRPVRHRNRRWAEVQPTPTRVERLQLTVVRPVAHLADRRRRVDEAIVRLGGRRVDAGAAAHGGGGRFVSDS
jgi:hypothetical protein